MRSKSNCFVPRRPSTRYWLWFSLSWLSIVAVLVSASVPADASALPTGNDLLYPRDIAYDDKARKALGQLHPLDREEAESALKELSSCGDDGKATMTMIGYKGGSMQDQVNQDRGFVQSPFQLNLGSPSPAPAVLLGVFDGHGYLGEAVSQYAVEELPRRLSRKLETALNERVLSDPLMTDDAVKRALAETFVEIDQNIPTKGQQGGCTASVVLQLGSRLYVANAGDSLSFVAAHVATSDKVEVVYVSREDKPDLPEEHVRITKMGGSVYFPSKLEDDEARAMYVDPETGQEFALAMSRSIGDWEVLGVIAEPIVDVIDLRKVISYVAGDIPCPANDEQELTESGTCKVATTTFEDVKLLVVSATDGIMDYTKPDDIARSFAKAFYSNEGAHPLQTCNQLIMDASRSWQAEFGGEYRDDITIAASKIALDSM